MKWPWQRHDDELDQELRTHLEMAQRDRIERGESEEEAAYAARREFGNLALVKETARTQWGWSWLERFAQDVRYGARWMMRSPGFAAVAALSLALGIGANTAVFSVINAVLLRSLPAADADQLVLLYNPLDEGHFPQMPRAVYDDFRNRDDLFSSVAGVFSLDRAGLRIHQPGRTEPESGSVRVQLVGGKYFSMMGVRPALGRLLTPDDDQPSRGNPVAVISHAYWERRFARDPEVLGRTFSLYGVAYSIVGIAPAGFTGDEVGHPADLWLPLAMQMEATPERKMLRPSSQLVPVRIVARLRPGLALAQASEIADAQYHRLLMDLEGPNPSAEAVEAIRKARIVLLPNGHGYAGETEGLQRPLITLLAIVSLLLLIACGNVANLLLARAAARQKEIATRLALGASRARILRQLLTESLLLSFAGGVAGWLIALFGTDALLRIVASGLSPVFLDAGPDLRVLAFTAAVCALSTILFGFAPAARATRVPLVSALKSSASGILTGRERFGLGRILVVSQVALSLLLLIAAGLFLRTLQNLRGQDLGFRREQLLLLWTSPAQSGRRGAPVANLYEAAVEHLARIPGVQAVSVSSRGLMGDNQSGSPISVPGRNRQPDEEWFVPWSLVTPGFFETAGIELLAGRNFGPQDTEFSPRVAIVNESFARFYSPGQNPIGMRFGKARDENTARLIIGVVRDSKYNSLREKSQKMVYFPYRQDIDHLMDMCVFVRTSANPGSVAAAARQELQRLDPDLPVLSIDTVDAQLDRTLVQERMVASLAAFFSGLALLLAGIGLYGVLSYSVARRTNEMGIRLALGANPGHVVRMVLRESMALVGLGVAMGIAAGMAATRLISNQLFGVAGNDPLTLAATTLLMVAVAGVASYLPARRAARVDPMVALRYE